MDILSHTFSGMAVGTVAMNFSDGSKQHKALILFLGTLGGFMPDLDVISMWSGFDGTIGALLGLEPGRQVYYAKHWYSHHAFMHSISAALLFSGIIWWILRKKKQSRKYSLPIVMAYFGGFMMHLLEDMPTPDFVWGGVRLFFPADVYIGGTGDIWWWNNYDIFLIIVSVILLNLSFQLIHLFKKIPIRKMSAGILVLGFVFSLCQMKTRDYDFQYSGFSGHNGIHNRNEVKSKEIQKEILGDKLFRFMTWLDNTLPIYF